MSRSLLPARNFYMMRHAQTEDNEKTVVSGRGSVTMLTEVGKKQAVAMQAVVTQVKPAYIVTSEMQRTKDTAEILCACPALSGLHRYVDSGINERAYGVAEGMLDADREKAKQAIGFIEGEETKEELRLRTVKTIVRSLLQREGVPLFITHGGNIRRIIEEALGKKLVESVDEKIANCGLYEFVAGEKWMVNMLFHGDDNEIKRQKWGNL